MSANCSRRSPLLQAVAIDNSIPIDPTVAELWLRDVENPLRWFIRPLLQLIFATLLHVTWALKRLPLPQFRAHGVLQQMTCWFCRNAVSPEANVLLLRHFATESNILNCLRDNSDAKGGPPRKMYAQRIDDMLEHTCVLHDQALFRIMRDIGRFNANQQPRPVSSIGPIGGPSR